MLSLALLSLLQAMLAGLVYFIANTSFLGGLAYFTTWRPVVGGFLTGLALGDPVRGAIAGGLVNVLYLGYLSVGGTLGIGDAALAGICGAAAAIHIPLPAGTAIGLGVVAGLLLGNLGFPLLALRMRLDNRLALRMDQAAGRGDARGVAWLNIAPAQALLAALTVPAAALLVLAVRLAAGWAPLLPAWLLHGLAVAGAGLSGALGIALALKFVFRGWGIPLFLAGYAAAALAGATPAAGATAALALAAVALAAAGVALVQLRRMARRAPPGNWPAPHAPWLLWQFFSHSAYSFERLQGGGFACALAPAIRRAHAGAAGRAAALHRHLAFFNTEVNFGALIVACAARFEAGGDGQRATAVKQSLMGALAGFGDPVVQGAVLPTVLSLALIALFGGPRDIPAVVAALALYVAAIGSVMLAVSYLSYRAGYAFGPQAAVQLLGSARLKRWVKAAECAGAFAFGALALAPGVVVLPARAGSEGLELAARLVLPLALILLLYSLLHRSRLKPQHILYGFFVAGPLLALAGLV